MDRTTPNQLDIKYKMHKTAQNEMNSKEYNEYDNVKSIQLIGYCAKSTMHIIQCKKYNAYNYAQRKQCI